MGDPIKILVVEDEMIIAAKISLQLSESGYEVDEILSRGEDAVIHAGSHDIDLVLLDINLKGEIDGIEAAGQIRSFSNVPIIFLTGSGDDATFNRAKFIRPAGFISKPFKQLDLQRAIELAICRMTENCVESQFTPQNGEVQQLILDDRIFVKCKDRMIKILLSDVLYIEADRNYSRIFTMKKEFLLAITLKIMEGKLPENIFVRIHRSYVINLTHVEEVGDSYVVIAGKPIPMSAGLKENLLQRIQTF
mgnify:CR=1 FL=1